MGPAAFLTLARPAPKLAPPRCSRVHRAVKREAGRALRQELANLRCPRNGKRPRRMTQAGSGASRVQVARRRGPLRLICAGRRAGMPPARIPAEARSLYGFMTRGLRGSGARSASRNLSSMLTPIVRTACGARRGRSPAAIARTAADADSSGSATPQVVAAPRRVARRDHAPCRRPSWLPRRSCPTVTQPRCRSTRCGGFRYPLYCAACRPREDAARRIAVVSRRCGRHAAGRRMAGPDRRNAESGCRSSRAAWYVAGRESRFAAHGIRAVRAMTSPGHGSSVHASTTCSTRMTSLRMPTTRRSATPVPRPAGNDGQRRRRASCAMPCGA